MKEIVRFSRKGEFLFNQMMYWLCKLSQFWRIRFQSVIMVFTLEYDFTKQMIVESSKYWHLCRAVQAWGIHCDNGFETFLITYK